MKTAAIVLVAGASTRFGTPKSKQVYLLKGKPVFSYSLLAFAKSKEINEIVVVVNKNVLKEIKDFISKNKIKATVVLGGKTRQESVENGLKSLSLCDNDIVLIHDGARPLIDESIIRNVKKAAIKVGAATTYISEVDTVSKINKNKTAGEFIARETIARIQTPQAFKFDLIKKAHKSAKSKKFTDDCSLVSALGNKIQLVEGSDKLHKITTINDISYLEGYLK